MDISLNHPYRLSLMDQQAGLTVPQLLVQALEVQMIRNHPNGMEKVAARLWARIDEKLWAALEAAEQDSGACHVALDASEHDFLRRELDKPTGIPPQNARALQVWETLLESKTPGAAG